MYSFLLFISNQLNTSHGLGTALGIDNSLENLLHLCINSLTEQELMTM